MKRAHRLLGSFVLVVMLLAPVAPVGTRAQSTDYRDAAPSLSADSRITPTPTPMLQEGTATEGGSQEASGARAALEAARVSSWERILGAESVLESVSVQGQWAYGVFSSARATTPITVTAHLMPDGRWDVAPASQSPIPGSPTEADSPPERPSGYWMWVCLYDDPGFSGASTYVTTPGQYSLESSFNDRAESITIPVGWSVRLYKDRDYSGPRLCLTGSDADLADNVYDDGTTATNSVTGMEVYSQATCPLPRPDKPSGLTVTHSAQTELTLSWDDNSDNEDGFNVYRWGFDGTFWTFLRHASVGANETTFVDSGLRSGTDYYYAVTAYNTSGESTLTDWVTGTTLLPGAFRLYLPLTTANYVTPVTVVSLEEDGEVGRLYCQDWWSCRAATSGNLAWSDLTYGSVSASYGPDNYAVKRTFLRFDTSAIPAGADVQSATLYVYSGASQAGSTGVHVVDASQGDDLATDDFNKVSFQSGGWAYFPADAWVVMPLNDVGKTWIAGGGTTELALLHELDLANAPPVRENAVSVAMSESGGLRPFLRLTYTP